MKPKTKSIVQFVVLITIGVLLLWFIYKQVAPEKDKIIDAFKRADYFWVFISIVIMFFAHFFRAYRWNYMLEPLGHKASLFNAVAAVFICYFVNSGTLRFGEVARSTVLDRYNKIPFQVGFGTIITERIVDFFLLLIIFILTLVFQYSELAGFSNEYIFDPLGKKLKLFYENPYLWITTIVVLAGAAFTLFYFRKKISGLLKGKFGNIIKGFGEGLASVKKVKNIPAFIFYSLLIWTCYFYSLYFCLFALPELSIIGHKECLTLMLFGTFGVMLTPGGLGTYHGIIITILTFYGIATGPAVALPWLVWTAGLVLVVLTGSLALILLPIVNKTKNGVSQ